jgi:hypothetical protein
LFIVGISFPYFSNTTKATNIGCLLHMVRYGRRWKQNTPETLRIQGILDGFGRLLML